MFNFALKLGEVLILFGKMRLGYPNRLLLSEKLRGMTEKEVFGSSFSSFTHLLKLRIVHCGSHLFCPYCFEDCMSLYVFGILVKSE